MEPERPIEKLLRGAAHKRRDQSGPPMELHPASRRLLQDEVARRTRSSRPGGFLSMALKLLRPSVIYATCGLVLIAIGLVVFQPRSTDTSSQLASLPADIERADRGENLFRSRQAQSGESALKEESVEVLDRAAGNRPVESDQFAFSDADTLSVPLPAVVPATPSTMPPSSPAPGEVEVATVDASRFATARDQAPQAEFRRELRQEEAGGVAIGTTNLSVVAQAGTLSSTHYEFSTGVTVASGTMMKQAGSDESIGGRDGSLETISIGKFVSTWTNAIPVLTAFELERTGEAIRIVDQDGSVYKGHLGSAAIGGAAVLDIRRSEVLEQSAGGVLASAGVAGLVQTNLFVVSGTNRQLGQLITFNGTLLHFAPLTNAFTRFGSDSGRPAATAAPARQPASGSGSAPPVWVIRGRVVLEGDRVMPVEAEAAGR